MIFSREKEKKCGYFYKNSARKNVRSIRSSLFQDRSSEIKYIYKTIFVIWEKNFRFEIFPTSSVSLKFPVIGERRRPNLLTLRLSANRGKRGKKMIIQLF